MKQQVGLTYRWIASDADFNKFAIKFSILLVATLIPLLMLSREGGEPVFIAIGNLEISKLTFRGTMWFLGTTMASACYSQFISCVVRTAVYDSVFQRLGVDLAMIHGFFAMVFFLMSLFGFWGIVCVPVSPPVLLLGLQFGKRFWLWVSNFGERFLV